MPKEIIKKLLAFTIIAIISLYGAYLFIKYDMEVHFNNKLGKFISADFLFILRLLDKDHKDFIRFHTTVEEKINYHGFKFEEHKIKTDDGYILTALRIPARITEINNYKKRAVMITHGLLDASYTFLAHGEKESLPFILASAG
jgi:hypothetical protein